MSTDFVCRRCVRPVSQQTPFFMTNCVHLLCVDCVKACIVNTTADSSGLFSVTCPVEEKVRKIMPLEKLPLEGKMLFREVGKVGCFILASLVSCHRFFITNRGLTPLEQTNHYYSNSYYLLSYIPSYMKYPGSASLHVGIRVVWDMHLFWYWAK